MEGKTVARGRVCVDTAGLLTRCHRLVHDEGFLGELRLGFSTIYTDASGREVRMERPSPWRRAVDLWEGTRVLGSARWRPLEARVSVQMDERCFWLQRAGRPVRTWELVAEGTSLLTIRRISWDRAEIVVHAPIDRDLLAFSYYLVVTRWRARHRHRST